MNQTAANETAVAAKTFSTADTRAALKNEILGGKVIAHAPSNRWHSTIVTNFVIAIGGRLQRSNHELYASDMKVSFGQNSICFPDIAVVHGEPEFADARAETLLNPTVLVEIFSSSAKTPDRTEKLEGFLAIPKLKECLLVNQNEMRIEHYAKQNAKQWIYRIYDERDDVISLDSIGCKLSLSEVYAQIKFKESELSSRAVN